jgi:signal transduction histidine kinase
MEKAILGTEARGGRQADAWRDVASSQYWLVGLVYFAAYVVFDWVSFRYELAPIGITPWNPAPGLSVALLLRGGLAFAPWVFASSVAADLIVRAGLSWGYVLPAAVSAAAGYGFVAAAFRRWWSPQLALRNPRDAVTFMVSMAIAAGLVAALQGLAGAASGNFEGITLGDLVVRFWAGDYGGVLVVTPLLLRRDSLQWSRLRARLASTDLETLLQIAALCASLWLVFGLESTDEFKFFFLTLVPIIWIALRHGLDGACLASFGGQLGMLLLIGFRGFEAHVVAEFQLLMQLTAAIGVAVGAAADEREAAGRSLRDQQAALAQFSRISVAGEMVSALAHELSQPLAAAVTYLAESRRLLTQRAPAEEVAESLDNAARQAKRASEVVARLRGFLYRGEATLVRTTAQALVTDALALVRPDVALNRTEISSTLETLPAPVLIDAVQMQQVIINAVRNAIEAMAEARSPQRRIDVTQRSVGRAVEIAVADSGPGLAAEIADRAFEPFVTTKAGGMGLGLAISRSIVEAHGGSLRFAPGNPGAVLVISVPRADAHD